MIKQITLSKLSDELAKTKTKKKEFLNRTMEKVVKDNRTTLLRMEMRE